MIKKTKTKKKKKQKKKLRTKSVMFRCWFVYHRLSLYCIHVSVR